MSVEPGNDLELEKQADYRTFTLTGNHYEIGRQWGMIRSGRESELVSEQEAAEVAQMLGLSIEQLSTLDMDDELPPEEVSKEESLSSSQSSFARDCLQIVTNFHPPLMDEFEGWADAAGKTMDSILSMLSPSTNNGDLHCSAFAWRAEDAMIVGRNYDFISSVRTRHLLRTEPVAYYATVGMNAGRLGGRQDGVNEHGLFVALASVMAVEAKRLLPGVIFHLVPRILLETCASAREAVMLAREMPHLMSYNYIVADPQETFVVEAYPGSVCVLEAEDGYSAVTNHFTHPELQTLMRSTTEGSSEQRLEKMISTLQAVEEASDPWSTAKSILTDHEVALCDHTEGAATLWSMLADLTKRRMAYSLGAPCRNQYEETPWPGKS